MYYVFTLNIMPCGSTHWPETPPWNQTPWNIHFLTLETRCSRRPKIHCFKGGSTQNDFHFGEQDYVEFCGYMVYLHRSIIQFHHSMGQFYHISRVRVQSCMAVLYVLYCHAALIIHTLVHHIDMLPTTQLCPTQLMGQMVLTGRQHNSKVGTLYIAIRLHWEYPRLHLYILHQHNYYDLLVYLTMWIDVH